MLHQRVVTSNIAILILVPIPYTIVQQLPTNTINIPITLDTYRSLPCTTSSSALWIGRDTCVLLCIYYLCSLLLMLLVNIHLHYQSLYTSCYQYQQCSVSLLTYIIYLYHQIPPVVTSLGEQVVIKGVYLQRHRTSITTLYVLPPLCSLLLMLIVSIEQYVMYYLSISLLCYVLLLSPCYQSLPTLVTSEYRAMLLPILVSYYSMLPYTTHVTLQMYVSTILCCTLPLSLLLLCTVLGSMQVSTTLCCTLPLSTPLLCIILATMLLVSSLQSTMYQYSMYVATQMQLSTTILMLVVSSIAGTLVVSG